MKHTNTSLSRLSEMTKRLISEDDGPPLHKSKLSAKLKTRIYADGATNDGPTLGVTDVEDWVTYAFEQNRYRLGLNTYQQQHNFTCPENFSFIDWVESLNPLQYTWFNSRVLAVEWEDGYLDIRCLGKTLNICVAGDRKFVEDKVEILKQTFSKPRNSINWVYNTDGDSISVPLNYRPALQSAYPWLDTPVSSYIQDYLQSEACVLILIGPPGTGKTTFIKNIIHQSEGNARVAYNSEVLDSDQFFAEWIEGNENILVLEDADTFLASRSDGNSMMHRFLNVSDGLISTAGKKIIFSTNLPSLKDVDSALMRPGRCYDVLQFRALSSKEADLVLNESGVERREELESDKQYTLAELFNPGEHTGTVVKRRIGF